MHGGGERQSAKVRETDDRCLAQAMAVWRRRPPFLPAPSPHPVESSVGGQSRGRLGRQRGTGATKPRLKWHRQRPSWRPSSSPLHRWSAGSARPRRTPSWAAPSPSRTCCSSTAASASPTRAAWCASATSPPTTTPSPPQDAGASFSPSRNLLFLIHSGVVSALSL